MADNVPVPAPAVASPLDSSSHLQHFVHSAQLHVAEKIRAEKKLVTEAVNYSAQQMVKEAEWGSGHVSSPHWMQEAVDADAVVAASATTSAAAFASL